VDSILETGKDGYNCDAEFDARTKAAVEGTPSEWGNSEDLWRRDAVEVLEFVQGDYQHVAPVLAKMDRYRLLDVGCGYGRLSPFLAAFRCVWYLGVDQALSRIDCAVQRYDHVTDTGPCVGFEHDDSILTAEGRRGHEGRWDVVWTSTVLQHLVLSDKKRLVETMKAARAPGGICLLREEEIWPNALAWCEERYARADHAKHMIPVPEDLMREWFAPLEFRRVGGNVWQAREAE